MALKLIMSWDIQPEREQEYFEFVVREFLPGVQRLGFELSDAWATVYGSEPQILVGVQQPDSALMRQVMDSDEWKSLQNQLFDYIHNYQQKLVEARPGFQF